MKYSLDKFLKIRFRSEKEIRDKLAQKGFSDSEIDKEISGLKKLDLINDKRFTKFWIEYRTEFKPRGRRFIEFELQQKGIKPEEFQDLFSEETENIKAKNLIFQKFNRVNLKEFKNKNKAIAYLVKYGFSTSIALDVLNNVK